MKGRFMKKKISHFFTLASFLAAAILLLPGNAFGKEGELGKEVRKKLISFGNSGFTPANVEKHLKELEEKWLPGYDGVNIIAHKKVKLPNGEILNLDWKWFSKTRFRKEWYKEEIKSLQNIHRRAKKFKYNFLDTSASSFTGEFDLFDDAFWDAVCNNFRVMAYVAREGKCTGIRFDLEDYGNQQKFLYRAQCGRSYEEAWNMARKRGRQWMNAVAVEYPDITLFCFFWLDLMFGFADGLPDTKGRLEACSTGLLVAFINGIYDALPPTARILDGMEERGYAAKTFADFCQLRGLRDARYKRLLFPENHKKLRDQTSLAVATYISPYYTPAKANAVFSAEAIRKKEGISRLAFFRRNLTYAIDFSDEFSWTYNGFSRKFTPIHSTHAWQEKRANTSLPEVPGPYIGMALPGIEEATIFAKNPYQYAMDRIRKDKSLKNLLPNGDFELTKTGKLYDIPIAPACEEVKKVPYWIFYRNKRSSATVSLAKGMGIDKKSAILLRGKEGGSIHTNVRVKQGNVYIVRAVSKTSGKGGGVLRIQWKNSRGRWHNHAMIIAAPYNEDLGNGWKRATLFVREIPEGSAYLCPLLTFTGTGKEDSILLDKVEVFNLFENAEKVAPHLQESMKKWQERKALADKAKILGKNVKVSLPGKGEKIPNGVFGAPHIAVSEPLLPGNIVLCRKNFQCGGSGKKPGKFFKAVGKNAGVRDDTSALLKDGDGYFVFPVSNVKEGEKYSLKLMLKKKKGTPNCRVQYSSYDVKKGFDYKKGMPRLQKKKVFPNGWEEYACNITIPARVHRFSVVISVKGLQKGDLFFIDDVSAKKIK